MKRRIFDAHIHVGEWGCRRYAERMIRPLNVEHRDYRDCGKYIEKGGIEYGLVVPTHLEDEERNFAYNALVQDCVEKVPSLYGGYWVTPLPECGDLTKRAIESIRHPKIRAFKMSPGEWKTYSLDPDTWDAEFTGNLEYILDASEQKGFAVQIHTGSGNSDPCKLDRFMNAYGKRARYHLVHMGEATGGILKFVPRFIEWIEAGYDVYTDQVMAPSFGIQWMARELRGIDGGLERLLFGTDSPWSDLESEYWKVEMLDVSDEVKDKILFKNACRVYGVPGSR
jgi:predicted TIM-barrel fold metal-dependent hydrolase